MVRDHPGADRQEVVLDVHLAWNGREALPGITLDLTMIDASGEVKTRRKLWVETGGLVRGDSRQIEFTVADLDYREGDGFYVEVRSPIPPEERNEYREFRKEAR